MIDNSNTPAANQNGKTEEKPKEEYITGRPFKFTDPVKLAQKIDQYFDDCDPHKAVRVVENGVNTKGHTIFTEREVMTEQLVYTVTGLALHLGVSRTTLLDYRKAEHYNQTIEKETRQELMNTVEQAFQRVEGFNEAQLHKNGISNGVKFNLTNNFKWQDKTVVETKPVAETLDDLDKPEQGAERNAVADEAKKALDEKNVHVPAIASDTAPVVTESPNPLPTEESPREEPRPTTPQ